MQQLLAEYLESFAFPILSHLGSLPQNVFSFLNKQKPSLSNINGDDLAPEQGEKTFKVIKNNQQTTPHTHTPRTNAHQSKVK